MIHRATKVIEQALQEGNIKYELREVNEHSLLDVSFAMKAGNNVTIHIISTSEDCDAALRVFDFVTVPAGREDAVLRAVNQINSQFRYAKFVLDGDKVSVQMDIPQRTENDLGRVAMELLARMVNIMDDAYPTLMKALWT